MIPLTKLQKEILDEFFNIAPTKVILDKSQRNALWNKAKKRSDKIDFEKLNKICPALSLQIKKSYETGHNIQSAVFSECVYAQTLAKMFSLDLFVNCSVNCSFISENITELLKSYNLSPRYAYSNNDKSRMLIQAGGCNGIDSALITIIDLNIYTIEFKEPYAKTSEPDLPKYKEDGLLSVTKDFSEKYPQFESMLNEQKNLNFFKVMGTNVQNFSEESINIAVSNNYTKKYADVICTEDKNGYFVMIPANQVSQWATIEGEIRPAGRNHYAVWTPAALNRFLLEKEAAVKSGIVTIKKSKISVRKERGGAGSISGYKINPLFFVYKEDCNETREYISFNINTVRQLNPTIAGKVNFKELKYTDVKNYYKNP